MVGPREIDYCGIQKRKIKYQQELQSFLVHNSADRFLLWMCMTMTVVSGTAVKEMR